MAVLIIWAQRVENAPDWRPSATRTPVRATEAQEAQDLRRLMDREQRFTDCLAFSAAPCDCRRQAASFTAWMRGVERMSMTRREILRTAQRITNAC